jgi:chromosome segregation ATPase
MKNQTGIIVLILLCVILGVALILNQTRSVKRQNTAAETILSLSNTLGQTSAKLEEQKEVNSEIETRLEQQKVALLDLTNTLNQTSADLKYSQEQVVKKDARIADLESQNQALDQRALELSISITNLNNQIAETRRKLAASEGDKDVLTRELARLQSEKADLERKFNDLSALRAQVAKIKEEMNIARRLDWMRRGIAISPDSKGAEQLMQKTLLAGASPPPRQSNYDLNVEISADGTVRVIPPQTNRPAANPPPR